MEIWKDVEFLNGVYMVSNMGRVKSLDRVVKNIRTRFVSGKIINPSTKDNYYLYVNLGGKLDQKCFYVHRLVAIAFIPNPENKPQVNHINGDKTDNRVENLEWVTSLENITHAISIGVMDNSGENHGNSKLSNEDIVKIRDMSGKVFQRDIAKVFGISQANVSRIVRGEMWNHV